MVRKLGTFLKVDRKYLESFEMCCWRRMKNISRTDHVRNEEVLQTVEEDRNILQTIKRRKATRMGHILRRNCLLNQLLRKDTGKEKRDKLTRKKT
jgi:hypothetical protein